MSRVIFRATPPDNAAFELLAIGEDPKDGRTWANGPWKTISKIRLERSRKYPIAPDDEDIALDELVEVNGSSRISAAYNVHGVDVRIIAVDREGWEHVPDVHSGVPLNAAHLASAKFPGLPLSRVREFHFQRRPYQHIEFRNVSLHRGQKIHVQIFVDGKPYIPK